MTLYVRIALYFFSGWLIARGVPADMAEVLKDPQVIADLSVGLGAVVLVATKFWHSLAKRYGWPT